MDSQGNNACFYLSCFSGYIQDSFDILHAELYAIYQGLAKEMVIVEIVFYSNFLHCIKLIKDPSMKFQVYAVLIQEIKNLIVISQFIILFEIRTNAWILILSLSFEHYWIWISSTMQPELSFLVSNSCACFLPFRFVVLISLVTKKKKNYDFY